MEEAIQIALVEEQSYNSASATAWYKPSAEKSDATPMELGNADVVCFKCGKPYDGSLLCQGPCWGKNAQQEDSLPKGRWQEPACETHEFCLDH